MFEKEVGGQKKLRKQEFKRKGGTTNAIVDQGGMPFPPLFRTIELPCTDFQWKVTEATTAQNCRQDGNMTNIGKLHVYFTFLIVGHKLGY